MSITGNWNVRMKTPIGSINAVFTFVEADGSLTGSAESGGAVAPMRDLATIPQADGTTTVTWSQSVTKPMRLNLDFEITVTGDTLSGFSRAGRLPRASVEGSRT